MHSIEPRVSIYKTPTVNSDDTNYIKQEEAPKEMFEYFEIFYQNMSTA